jgi:hypothetical protein
MYFLLIIKKYVRSIQYSVYVLVTQDDIWHPIYVKYEEKVLNSWKSRRLSLLENYIVVIIFIQFRT